VAASVGRRFGFLGVVGVSGSPTFNFVLMIRSVCATKAKRSALHALPSQTQSHRGYMRPLPFPLTVETDGIRDCSIGAATDSFCDDNRKIA